MCKESPAGIVSVILCGNSGTRLWPACRESRPKQVTSLVNLATSTYQTTVRRVADPVIFAQATMIASAEPYFIVAEQLTEARIPPAILLEPKRRHSAAAGAEAVRHAARRGPKR